MHIGRKRGPEGTSSSSIDSSMMIGLREVPSGADVSTAVAVEGVESSLLDDGAVMGEVGGDGDRIRLSGVPRG